MRCILVKLKMDLPLRICHCEMHEFIKVELGFVGQTSLNTAVIGIQRSACRRAVQPEGVRNT
jgi:hypothetical protein